MVQMGGKGKMTPKNKKLIGGVLAGVALIGVVGLVALMPKGGGGPVIGPGTPVVVAAHDITARQVLDTSDLTVVSMSSPPPDTYSKVADVKGLVAGTSYAKGQPLLSNQLLKDPSAVTDITAAYLPLPQGFVAFAIPNGDVQGVADYIQPGDYITVMVTVPNGRYTQVRTVMTNLHVLRVGTNAADATAATDKSAQKPTYTPGGLITVVVTQCQAEVLQWLMANTTMKYTLPSYKDYQPSDGKADPACPNPQAAHGVTVNDINRMYPGLMT